MTDRVYPELIPAARFTRGPALVLAPHPDDEVATCGGMVLHHVAAGNPVDVVFLTDGARGSWKAEREEAYVVLREQEARAACAFQGTREPRFLRFPDGGLGSSDGLVPALREVLSEVRPFVVYAPSFFEIHGDHHHTARALLEAVGGSDQDPLLMFGEIGAPTMANVLIDVTGVMDRKIRALQHHASQLAANDYVPSLRGLDQYRTVNIDKKGVDFAEAYLAGKRRDLIPMLEVTDRLSDLARRAARELGPA